MARRDKRGDAALLLALACGATVEQAARQAGLSEATVYRRLQEPEFREELSQVRADIVQRATGTLTAAALEAVKALVGLLATSQPPPVRLGAARSILEFGMKLREVVDLEARLAALEAQLGGGPDRTKRFRVV